MEGETDRSRRVAALQTHPAWGDLKAEFAEIREQRSVQLGKRFMAGQTVDQREIDRERGFWAGVAAVLETPHRLGEAVKRTEGTER